MKKEFSIKKYNEATVYTLESATSGGTSAGAVASVSMPMGGVRKRGDNLIAQEANKDKVPATTPRNFVAKNAKSSGAGAHKDKKKAEKQGDFKHKKSYADALQEMTDAEVAKLRADAEAHLKAQLNKTKEVPKKKSFMQQVGDKQIAMVKGAWKGVTGQKEDHSTAADGWGRGSYDTYAGGRHGRGVAENPEWYNDEANDMSSAQLKSLVKHAAKLRQAVKAMQSQGDTLEPWQQSKVTKAADYLDAVFNAVDNDHDMGEQGSTVDEGLDSYRHMNPNTIKLQNNKIDVANRKFPDPRKPYIENGRVTGIMGPDGRKYPMSKSDTVGADGMIYNFQDPRARGKQTTKQDNTVAQESNWDNNISRGAEAIAKFILANIFDRVELKKYAMQTPNPTLFWNAVERANNGGNFNDIVQIVTPNRPWHKMEDVEEEPSPRHRVSVEIKDPETLRNIHKVIRVHADNKEDALKKVKAHYANKDIYVANMNYIGQIEDKVDEGAMSEIDYEIGEMMGKYIEKYQAGLLDADHFISLISKASAILARNYKMDPTDAQQLVSDYVEQAIGEQGVAEVTGDPKFDKMLKGITGKKAVAKQQKTDTKQQARDAFGSMFGGGNPADKLGIRKPGVAEDTYMEELAKRLAEKIPKNAPVDVWIKDFEKSTAPQFKGKNKEKRRQMAVAASYGAKNPKKK